MLKIRSMNKILQTFLLCLGWWTLGISQNVTTISADNRWVVDYHDYTINTKEIRVYTFASRDTLFNNKNYKELVYYRPADETKILPTHTFYRQENQRLYKYNGDEQDILLIDFGAKTGDTLWVETPDYQSKPLYIVFKDTITLMDGTERTKINFVCLPEDFDPLPQPSDTGWSFVEGLGQLGQLFMSEYACTAADPLWDRTIRCYYEKGNLIWRAGDVFDCLSSQTSDVQTAEVRLFPNPVSDDIQISSKIDFKFYEIFSATGYKVFDGKIDPNHQIWVSYLPQGCYLLMLHDSNGRVITEKFGKM